MTPPELLEEAQAAAFLGLDFDEFHWLWQKRFAPRPTFHGPRDPEDALRVRRRWSRDELSQWAAHRCPVGKGWEAIWQELMAARRSGTAPPPPPCPAEATPPREGRAVR